MKTWFEEFKDPENEYRPKARYWMPHGVVSDLGIQKDVKDLYKRGFGSIEAVAMTRGLKDGFYTRENMWGSDLWLSKMNVLLSEAKKYNMTVDISNGPIWPIVDVTANKADDETTLYEVAYGLKILKAGEMYSGEVPKPLVERSEGTKKLIAVSLYKITGEHEINFESYQALPLSDAVSVSVPNEGENWAMFSFWERPAVHKNGIFYVADHYSKKASKAIMDFWEHKIVPAFGENLSVCRSIFCDSLEFRTDLDWSRTFVQDFEARKGYSILPYLPVLGSEMESGKYIYNEEDEKLEKSPRCFSVYPPANISGYRFSDKALQHRVNFDYFEMLTHLYCENHVGYMQKRAEKMGLSVRYQVAYGRTLQTEASALYPAIPENEGLGACHLDRYRNMAGAAHIGRKKVYSFECAAEAFNSYGQTHEDILWWMKRAYAGGMNMQVLHGAHYCGYYDGEGNENGLGPGIDWPGFEGFTRRTWSNAWNRTLSAPEQKRVWDFFARCNFVLQNTAKTDVAVYSDTYLSRTPECADGKANFKDNNALNNSGYTYEFLSPALLLHENARVSNGVLDENGAAYKALVIHNEEFMSFAAAERIAEFAAAGLLIVFTDIYPDKCAYNSDKKTDEELKSLIWSIPHLFVKSAEDVPKILKENGVLPDAEPSVPALLRPVHAVTDHADFYYMYNANVFDLADEETRFPNINKGKCMRPFDGAVTFKGSGDVYEIDAFSGAVTRIAKDNGKGRQTAEISLAPDEAKLYAVMTENAAKDAGMTFAEREEVTLAGTAVPTGWLLEINEILPPENKVGTIYESVWRKKAIVSLSRLVPWCDISEDFERTCGIGTYKAKFVLPKDFKKAELCLENVCDTYTVFVNGIMLEQGDPALRTTDITNAARSGENDLEISVSSLLQNVASLDFLLEQGKKTGPQRYGIWGKAVVKIFR